MQCRHHVSSKVRIRAKRGPSCQAELSLRRGLKLNPPSATLLYMRGRVERALTCSIPPRLERFTAVWEDTGLRCISLPPEHTHTTQLETFRLTTFTCHQVLPLLYSVYATGGAQVSCAEQYHHGGVGVVLQGPVWRCTATLMPHTTTKYLQL